MKDYPEDESKNWEFVSLNIYGPFKGKMFLFFVDSVRWKNARDTVQCVAYLLPW